MDNEPIPDDIMHLIDEIGHTSEAVVILEAVVEYALLVDLATDELNWKLFNIMNEMDDLSPGLQDWLDQRKELLDDGGQDETDTD